MCSDIGLRLRRLSFWGRRNFSVARPLSLNPLCGLDAHSLSCHSKLYYKLQVVLGQKLILPTSRLEGMGSLLIREM